MSARELTVKDYSPAMYPWPEGAPERFSIAGVRVSLLTSDMAIALEGQQMNHCVALFCDYVGGKSYIVFSLRSLEDRSTLGISISKNRYSVDQHYGPFNELVENGKLIAAEKEIIKILGGGGLEKLEMHVDEGDIDPVRIFDACQCINLKTGIIFRGYTLP